MTYKLSMYTIIETPTFKNDVEKIWSEQERGDFFSWLAANPSAGDVIPNILKAIENE